MTSNQIRMGQLDENILERSPSLSQFAHGPTPLNGEAENFFAHIRTGFDSQRKSLPIGSTVCDHVSNARNLF